jgi:hypothetical protein
MLAECVVVVVVAIGVAGPVAVAPGMAGTAIDDVPAKDGIAWAMGLPDEAGAMFSEEVSAVA